MEIKTRSETRQTLALWLEEKGFQKGYQEELLKVKKNIALRCAC